MGIQDQTIGSENKNQNDNNNNNTKRVCQFCLKEFRSGKALGGHMRIHFQRAPKNNGGDDDEDDAMAVPKKKLKIHHQNQTDSTFKKPKQQNPHGDEEIIISAAHGHQYQKKKHQLQCGGDCCCNGGSNVITPNCVICGKDFQSWKSLYGHMRCHPERGWKGINPPSSSSVSAYASFSFSGSDVDDNDHLSASGERKKASAAVDLAAALKGWPVTSERGRKGTAAASSSEVSSSSVVDVEMLDAVNYLLMLSREAPSQPKFGESNEPAYSDDKVRKPVIGHVFWQSANETEHDKMNKNKKKRKNKAMSADLTPVVDNKYICGICGKSFSSHQAFGGHRSSHNKLKIMIINNSNENLLSDRSTRSKESSSGHLPIKCMRGLDFDLNEVPPISEFES
ncbi:hypothetical protein OROGR_001336 [Orobanche gracilis]